MFYDLLCVTWCTLCSHLDEEDRAGCFSLFVFMVYRDWCVALPHDDMGLSAVCDSILTYYFWNVSSVVIEHNKNVSAYDNKCLSTSVN